MIVPINDNDHSCQVFAGPTFEELARVLPTWQLLYYLETRTVSVAKVKTILAELARRGAPHPTIDVSAYTPRPIPMPIILSLSDTEEPPTA